MEGQRTEESTEKVANLRQSKQQLDKIRTNTFSLDNVVACWFYVSEHCEGMIPLCKQP